MELIVVEQRIERRLTQETFERLLEKHAWCRRLYGIRHVQSLIATRADRMVCVFQAPDVEAVRALARRMGFPYEHAWSAQRVGACEHEPACYGTPP